MLLIYVAIFLLQCGYIRHSIAGALPISELKSGYIYPFYYDYGPFIFTDDVIAHNFYTKFLNNSINLQISAPDKLSSSRSVFANGSKCSPVNWANAVVAWSGWNIKDRDNLDVSKYESARMKILPIINQLDSAAGTRSAAFTGSRERSVANALNARGQVDQIWFGGFISYWPMWNSESDAIATKLFLSVLHGKLVAFRLIILNI